VELQEMADVLFTAESEVDAMQKLFDAMRHSGVLEYGNNINGTEGLEGLV